MTDTETYYVTSHLMVGAMPTHLSGVFIRANSVSQAVRGLRAGASVVLPRGRFDLAREVLLQLGADPARVEFDLALAQGLLPVDSVDIPQLL